MIKEETLVYSVIDQQHTTNQEVKLKVKKNHQAGMYIIHRALMKQLIEQKNGNASTKTRSEVRGGGRKPWKQKGTGRARAGSIRSPLWKGGGVIFGPKTRNYTKKINKKEKRLALRTLIYNKFRQTTIVSNFLDNLKEPSTKSVIQNLENLQIYLKNKDRILIVVEKKDKNLYLSTRNLQNIEFIAVNQLNILSILKAQKLLMTVDSLKKIHEIYNG